MKKGERRFELGLTILKLGGSVITIKAQPYTANSDAIKRLAGEIHRADVKPLIIIHGGGSYGHPTAAKYRIKEGYKVQSQAMGFSETHQAMVTLNKMVLDVLIKEGVPAVTVQPSAFILTEKGRIRSMETEVILTLLELGITPVLYGDVVLDSTLGFTILSGDQLVSAIAIKLGADRIIMGIDVDGLYTANPKVDLSAHLIPHLTPQELRSLRQKIGEVRVTDVTGGMTGKMLELMPAVAQGIKAIIVNASKPSNLYKVLKGEKVPGTIIEARKNVA
jgi:isopentenyl phosphate kinase